MKSVRQRKVFVWEKTSPFWWNSYDSIYNRVSYRNSPNAVLRHRKFWETTRKIRISKPKSKIRGILNFKQLMEASLHRSNGPRDQLHFGVPTTDFFSQILEFCNTYYSSTFLNLQKSTGLKCPLVFNTRLSGSRRCCNWRHPVSMCSYFSRASLLERPRFWRFLSNYMAPFLCQKS